MPIDNSDSSSESQESDSDGQKPLEQSPYDLADETIIDHSPPAQEAVEESLPAAPSTRASYHSQTNTFVGQVTADRSADGELSGDFGRYQILGELGRGAMGTVYLAHDSELDRKVALKVPQFIGSDRSEQIQRFRREARAMASVRHPGLCPGFDVGEIDGVHYLTMAYIDGRPLSDFTREDESFAELHVAALVCKLALAIEEAHQNGIVHRDLKPANIMIDKRLQPIIMDFGLARRNQNEIKLTQTGNMVGTPAYMSPEQIDGDLEKIGPASDIYSLGVICYRLLSGKLPFEGSIGKLMVQVLTRDPPALTDAAGKPVDPALESICLKAMAKQAEDRQESAAALAAELHEYITKSYNELSASRSNNKALPDEESSASESQSNLRHNESITDRLVAEMFAGIDWEMLPRSADSEKSPTAEIAVWRKWRRQPLWLKVTEGIVAVVLFIVAGVLFTHNALVDATVIVDDASLVVCIGNLAIDSSNSGKPVRLKPGDHKYRIEHENRVVRKGTLLVRGDGKTVLRASIANNRVRVTFSQGGKTSTSQGGRRISTAKSGTTKKGVTKNGTPQSLILDTNTPEKHALRFGAGSESYVSVAIPTQAFKTALTVEAWVTCDSVERSTILFATDQADEKPAAIFRIGRNLNLQFFSFSRSLYGPMPEEGRKIHLAAVIDDGKWSLYVDGKQAMFLTQKSSTRRVDRIEFGRPHGRFPRFKGLIHEFRLSRSPLYMRDFTPRSHFGTNDSTIALYHFDEGTGNVLHDSSANDYHGKIVGAHWINLAEPHALPETETSPGTEGSPSDPDRKVAEWLFRDFPVKLTIRMPDGLLREIEESDEIPSQSSFHIISVHFGRSRKYVLTDDDVKTLAASGLKHLERVDLFGSTSITIDAYKHLLRNVPDLKFLRFYGRNNSVAFDEFAAIVPQFKKLEELRIQYATSRQVAGLTPLLSNLEHLQHIGIHRTDFSADSLGHLVEMPQLTSLRISDSPEVFQQGSLTTIGKIQSLRHLEIVAKQTVSSKSNLSQIGSLRKLESLSLTFPVSEKTIQALKDKLPHCEFTYIDDETNKKVILPALPAGRSDTNAIP